MQKIMAAPQTEDWRNGSVPAPKGPGAKGENNRLD